MSWLRDIVEAFKSTPAGRPMGTTPPPVQHAERPPPSTPAPKKRPDVVVAFTVSGNAELQAETERLGGMLKKLQVEMADLCNAHVRRQQAQRFREAGW